MLELGIGVCLKLGDGIADRRVDAGTAGGLIDPRVGRGRVWETGLRGGYAAVAWDA